MTGHGYTGYAKIAETTNTVSYSFTFAGGINQSGITFEIDANNDLIIDVNDATVRALGVFFRGVDGVGARCGNGPFSTYKSPKFILA